VPRPSTGQVVERQTSQGRRFAIRFRALGERRYQTLDVSTRAEAEAELANVLADVRRGLWKPPVEQVVTIPKDVPSFHAYASEWHARRKGLVKPRRVTGRSGR
jgi:hypothetical protein